MQDTDCLEIGTFKSLDCTMGIGDEGDVGEDDVEGK
jgi:hypothetical protein